MGNFSTMIFTASGGAPGVRDFVVAVDGRGIYHRTFIADTVSLAWDPTNFPDGPHSLSVTVKDTAGQTATASVSITFSNGIAPPPLSAAITSPASGSTVNGSVPVTMTVGNPSGSWQYVLKQDNATTIASGNVAQGTNTATVSWNTMGVSKGSHTLNLSVTDGMARTATAAVTVAVSNQTGGTQPTVTITSPSSGVWTGNSIEIIAKASSGAALATIKFWGNGAVFATASCGATTCTGDVGWITGPLPPAAYQVQAVATDSAGQCAVSAPVTINKDATSP
ncbi:MAG TPA: Ig-like domain-containing protein, partial [Mycobacteriales bacterium]|nr:Ig-like domain-containing protein [Mycobacteriales bacterium]